MNIATKSLSMLSAGLMLALLSTACGTDPAGSSEAGTSETTGDDPFVFAEDAADQYAQLDRIGMPAIGTAVITSKDDYNAADPAADAAGDFVAEITANVEGLHSALDDDLTGLGLTPCAVADCVAQAAPLVVPDTIKVDTTMPSGFPNGRKLEDPVIDVTLAVVLLDLTVDGQTATSLVGTNPTANDLEFGSAFPFLAEAHAP